ncbi:hypothetical protein DFH07DRAFT_756259, partial [Mycena maculata]
PGGQYASCGNICVLAQDPGPFVQQLPPPLSSLRDDICVVLVGSPNTVITESMLKKSPLLVRRGRIIKALLWLKTHNPLYDDLNIRSVYQNASAYPEEGIPLPFSELLCTTPSSEGSSYTDPVQSNTEQFAGISTHGMPSSTVVDADSINSSFRRRKAQAIEQLKNGNSAFMKLPSGSKPLVTRNNPTLFGYLWPTLFPYGVGMFEDTNIQTNQELPFRKVDLKTHVAHLLRSSVVRVWKK